MRISLAVIVKDEAEKLDNLLQSCAGIFDEICLTMTKKDEDVEKVAKKHKAKTSTFKWVNDFSAARNFNFSQCTGDWIVWFDADDVLDKGENLRKNIELADANNVTGLSMLYHYSHDKYGNLADHHWKLQAVKNEHYEWRGIIHENLLPIKESQEARISDVIRVHTADDVDSKASLLRNKKILEQAIKTEPEEPRHYFYLARCYLGTEEWEKVLEVVDTYLTLSDWPEERYDAINMKGEAYLRLGDFDEAIKTHHTAILEVEDAPDAYIYKARNFVRKERWLDAITCLEIAETRDQDKMILKKTALYDHDLYVMTAISYLNLGLFEQALQAAERAYKNRPTDESKDILELATQMHKDEILTKHYLAILKENIKDTGAISRILTDIPERIKDDPRLLTYARELPPQEWAENSVTWFCGDSVDSWDGDTLNKGGIGGSETAVIKLSEELVKQGKEVTVYNKCDAPVGGKVVNGVKYVNFWEINHLDHFNTLILWRWPQYADMFDNAKNLVLDMHDVSNAMYFTEERVNKIDTIMVKSEYHRSLYPDVPDDKFTIVGNGIDLARFTEAEKEPYRFIYTSCASRGLETVLEMWPKIKEKYEDAELHIFYGWKNYYEAHKENPAKMSWMHKMEEAMLQDGVINHGRVGQQELADEMAKSNVWLYPTRFPEIHCITALEMQAANVYPITTGFAALEETQQSGVKISGDPTLDEWQNKALNEIEMAIDNPDMVADERANGRKWVEDNTWERVSNVWAEVV